MTMGCSPSSSLSSVPVYEIAHRRFYMLRQCVVIYLAGRGSHVIWLCFVVSNGNKSLCGLSIRRYGVDFIRLFQQHFMEISDEDLVERFVSFYCVLYRFYRLIMPLNVQMIAHRLPVGSEPMEDQTSRFSESQAVAFYGIGVVVRLNPELLLYPPHDVRRQWSQFVQLSFQPINFFNDVAHGMILTQRHEGTKIFPFVFLCLCVPFIPPSPRTFAA